MFSGTDLKLARRIEAGHVHSGLVYQDACLAVAGGMAIFGGLDSPFTQALGVGMNGPVTAGELDQLAEFFRRRGSKVPIDLCTLADPSIMALIQERGYAFNEVSNVLVCAVTDLAREGAVTEVAEDQMRPWTRMVLQGFMEGDEAVPEELVEAMTKTSPGFRAYYGGAFSAAAMEVHDGIGTLFGDATLPQARGAGWQQKLIRHRLGEAFRMGCDLASASVWPGSISHRNYERAGFELVYARVKVTLAG